jgi:hypothetical protein
MKLHPKVVAAMQQQHVVTQAFTLAVGACPDVVLFKFAINKDC